MKIPSNLTQIGTEFLFTERVEFVGQDEKLSGPFGSRLLAPAVEGTFEGPRLKGILVPRFCNDFATDMGDGVIDAKPHAANEQPPLYSAYKCLFKEGRKPRAIRGPALHELQFLPHS